MPNNPLYDGPINFHAICAAYSNGGIHQVNSHRCAVYCLILLAPFHTAISQESTGSLAVFRATPQHAILSVESRAMRTCHDKKIVMDNKCKVLTFDNKYIFAVTGLSAAYDPMHCDAPPLWIATEVTKGLYKSGDISSVSNFSDTWIDKVGPLLYALGTNYDPHQHRMASIFIGIANGGIASEAAILEFVNGKVSGQKVVSLLDGSIDFMGSGDVITEYRANQTERARRWHERIEKLNWEDQVPAIVHLAIENDTSGELGGTVRTVRITPFGTEWLSGECSGTAKKNPHKKTTTKSH